MHMQNDKKGYGTNKVVRVLSVSASDRRFLDFDSGSGYLIVSIVLPIFHLF